MTGDRRLLRLRALVDRIERLPASPRREWMLQEARARLVDVETGDEPRPMRALQEASGASEPPQPGSRVSNGHAVKRPGSTPAPVAAPRGRPRPEAPSREQPLPVSAPPASPGRTPARPSSAPRSCCGSRMRRTSRSPGRAMARPGTHRGGEGCAAERVRAAGRRRADGCSGLRPIAPAALDQRMVEHRVGRRPRGRRRRPCSKRPDGRRARCRSGSGSARRRPRAACRRPRTCGVLRRCRG